MKISAPKISPSAGIINFLGKKKCDETPLSGREKYLAKGNDDGTEQH
jgi:hypothetical protein